MSLGDFPDWRTSLGVWHALDGLLSDNVSPDTTLDMMAGGRTGKRQPPREPNYLRKLRLLHRCGALPVDVGLHQLDIYHDSWCQHLQGGRCDCNPDIRRRRSQPDPRRN
jgi:hypothetical protein